MLLWLRWQTINSDCILLGQSTDSCNCKDILFSSFIPSDNTLLITWPRCPLFQSVTSGGDVWLWRKMMRVIVPWRNRNPGRAWNLRGAALFCTSTSPSVWVEKATAWKVKVDERRIIWSKAELILFGRRVIYIRLENCEVMRLGAEKWDFWKRRGRKKTMETAKYQEPFRVSPSSLSLKGIFISMVCHLLLWSCHHYQGKDIAKYREPFRVSPTLQWHLSPPSGTFFARPL